MADKPTFDETTAILNELLTGVIVHAADTSIIFANRKATDVLGLTCEQLLGKCAGDPAWNFVDEDLVPMVVADYPVSQAVATGKPCYDCTVGIKRPDRSYITWTIVNAIPVFSKDRHIEKVVVDFMEFTRRKQTERQLQRNEELLVASQALAKVGGWEMNLKNQATFWTDEMYRIHDLDPARFISIEGEDDCSLHDHASDEFISIDEAVKLSMGCYDPKDQSAVMEAFRKCAEEGIPYDLEFPFTTTKGRRLWIRTIANPVREGDSIVKVVGTFMDITAQKQEVEEKHQLERQVQHAQKLESLGVLAGGIAHDFNNLLMTIIGSVDLALNRVGPDSPAIPNLREIEQTARRASELSGQMLAYSGRGQFVIEPIDLNDLLKETAQLLEVSISKKAELKYDLIADLPPFDGDATQIRQVMMNLIINASEAIGDREGVITLSTNSRECSRADLDETNDVLKAAHDQPLPEGVYVCLKVTDTGCGMDAGTLAKIFDPFFTTKFSGRGLGMATILGIVRGHKGALMVESGVDAGTTLQVLFPASERRQAEAAPLRKKVASSANWQGTGTVLIVDDDKALCVVGEGMVELCGFTPLVAGDGREAVEVFREHSNEITCVLLDLTMPHMDGEEAFLEMRSIDPEVTVILCSGYNEKGSTERFAGKGLAGFLQKPYNLAQLRSKFSEVLGDQSASAT